MESRSLRRLAFAVIAIILMAGLAKAGECETGSGPADPGHQRELTPAEPGDCWSDGGTAAGTGFNRTLSASGIIDVSADLATPRSGRANGFDTIRFTIQRK